MGDTLKARTSGCPEGSYLWCGTGRLPTTNACQFDKPSGLLPKVGDGGIRCCKRGRNAHSVRENAVTTDGVGSTTNLMTR